MAKISLHVVSRASCASRLVLGERLCVEAAGGPPGDEVERLSPNRNVLAAPLRAATAAVYLEHGFEIATGVVGRSEKDLEQAGAQETFDGLD